MWSRRAAWMAGGLLLLLIVSGCAFLSAAAKTESSLQNAGYQDVGVNLASGSGQPADGMVTVSYRRGPTGNDERDARHAEQIVWDSLRYRFGALSIVKTSGGCTGPVCVSHSGELDSVTYAQLAARFGPRPRGLDAKSAAHALSIPGWAAGVGLAVALTVLAAGAVIIVVLVRKSRRRPPPPGPWSAPPGPRT